MAELPPSRNGGERLDLTIGGQSVGLTSRDLIPVLLILLGGLVAYFFYVQMRGSQAQIVTTLLGMRDTQVQIVTTLVNMREVQVQIMEGLAKNHEATIHESQAMRELHHTQMDYFRKLLTTMDHNMSHGPTERYPLELVPPPGVVPPQKP